MFATKMGKKVGWTLQHLCLLFVKQNWEWFKITKKYNKNSGNTFFEVFDPHKAQYKNCEKLIIQIITTKG